MCRLFGMSGGAREIHATFWLLDAPCSIAEQSHTMPDGNGVGWFDDGKPCLDKDPLPAHSDLSFHLHACTVDARTFIAHVRLASTGPVSLENSHPFEMSGRLFAHNGVVGDLEAMEAALGEDRAVVKGDTDSERMFAVITRAIDRNGGDVRAGVESGTRWLAENIALYAINFVLITPSELFALRYPEKNNLYVLDRSPGGPHGDRQLDQADRLGRLRVRSDTLAECEAVVVASERLDEDPHWRLVEPGELVHVDGELNVRTDVILPDPPAHQLQLKDLSKKAAESQIAE